MAREVKLLFVFCLLAGSCLVSRGEGADLVTQPPPIVDHAANTTTENPAANTTTVNPAANTTTVDPAANTTTVDPAATTTTVDPAATTTTTAPGANATTAATGNTTTTAAPPPPTSTPEDVCAKEPCRDGSTCEPRANSMFVCVCLGGEVYDYMAEKCDGAKVFPGELSLPSISYKTEMADTKSAEFLEAANKITNDLDKTLRPANSGYLGSTVLKIEPAAGSARADGIKATVEMNYQKSSNITQENVEDQIKEAAKPGGALDGASLASLDLCKTTNAPCDGETTDCRSEDGSFTCSCKGDYVKTDFSTRVCIACPSGKEAKAGSCVNCPFGYSGLNCAESWKLVLVIVGSVLGTLLLLTLILLPLVSRKAAKKGSKKNKDVDNGKTYSDKSPLVNDNYNSRSASANGFANAGVPRIPRATTTNLEMTQSNQRQNLGPAGRSTRLYDEPNDMNPYAQSRNQGNPYAQNRSQGNPYASRQGQSNPYYTHDDGRRLN